MADTVTTKTLKDGTTRLVVLLTCVGDGTGESGVTKVDKSTFLASDGAEPASLDIERVEATVTAFPAVNLLWDHTTDDTAIVLPAGHTVLDFGHALPGEEGSAPILADPRSSGGTGDLLLTSSATASGAYMIKLTLIKQPS